MHAEKSFPRGKLAQQWKEFLLVSCFASVILSPFSVIFLDNVSSFHFYLTGLILLAFGILFAARISRYGYKSGLISKISTLNLIYILVLYFFAVFKGNLDRSCFSIIVVTFFLFMGQNFVGLENLTTRDFIENSLFKLLKIYFSMSFLYILFGFISHQPNFQKFNTEAGLYIPIATTAIILGFYRRSIFLISLVTALLSVTFIAHYQTSYLLIFICTPLFIYRGSFFKLVKLCFLTFMFSYLFLSIFTNMILWILQSSSSSGYDNITVRAIFAEHGLAYVREHFIAGGALTYPLTTTVKIGTSYSVLPLHSDALTFMIGIGALGWFLHASILLLMVNKAWHRDSNCLERVLSCAITTNFLAGIVNPQYGTYTYLYVMVLTSIMSLSARTAPTMLTDSEISK